MQTVRLAINLPDISNLTDAKTPLEALQWGMMQSVLCLRNAEIDPAKVDEAFMILKLSSKFASRLKEAVAV